MKTDIVQFNLLNRHSNIIYAISTIPDGNMSFRWGEIDEVIANRRRFLAKFNLQLKNCAVMEVAHGDKIAQVNKKDRGRGTQDLSNTIKVDALITNQPNIVLFLLTADCLPIIFYDPQNQAIALGHLGWKSTDQKLSQEIIKTMVNVYKSEPAKIIVAIGPGIHKESYIYWYDTPPQKSTPAWQPYLKNLASNQTNVDVIGYNHQQLLDIGILKKNIEITSIDTARSPDYFSHYRSIKTGEPEGRFATFVMITTHHLID